jgi:hypothetical protein
VKLDRRIAFLLVPIAVLAVAVVWLDSVGLVRWSFYLLPVFYVALAAPIFVGTRPNGWLWRHGARVSDEFFVARPTDEVLGLAAGLAWHQGTWKTPTPDFATGTLALSNGRPAFSVPRRLIVTATPTAGGSHVAVTALAGVFYDPWGKNRQLVDAVHHVLTSSPRPGWFADPWRQSHWRWWDGVAWTPATGP